MSNKDYDECPYLTKGGWFGLTYRCTQNDDEEISNRHYDDYCLDDSYYKTDEYEYYNNNGSICFLTMSCIKKKLSNHCLELDNLRSFRDSYMNTTPEGKTLVQQYYVKSPHIVKAINRDADSNRVWSEIYDKYIVPCVELIEKGTNEGYR